jgi:predicted lactoylglutathione lyase
MHKQIYVNLAVKDLARSKAFFKALGFGFDPQFTNEQAAGMIVGENIYVMLLPVPFFQSFITKPVADAHQSAQVLICISCDDRAEVDALVAGAVAAGGRALREPQDHGFMYTHSFEDLDGYIWEPMAMHGTAPA